MKIPKQYNNPDNSTSGKAWIDTLDTSTIGNLNLNGNIEKEDSMKINENLESVLNGFGWTKLLRTTFQKVHSDGSFETLAIYSTTIEHTSYSKNKCKTTEIDESVLLLLLQQMNDLKKVLKK